MYSKAANKVLSDPAMRKNMILAERHGCEKRRRQESGRWRRRRKRKRRLLGRRMIIVVLGA